MRNRRPQALLLAVLALLVVAALAPSAQGAQFHSGLSESTVTSTPDGTSKMSHHVLDLAAVSVTCLTPSYTGTIAGTTVSEFLLKAVYEGSLCIFAGQSAHFLMPSCAFLMKANGELSIVSHGGINCAEHPIEIWTTSPECKIKIGPQTIKNAVSYSNINVGFNTEITMELHATGITYTAAGVGCPETGVKTNGTYTTGNTILTAEKTAGPMTSFSWSA